MSILITAASHSHAYKLARILEDQDVVFGDHQQLSQLAFPGKKLMQIPAGDSTSYAHEMLNLALDAGIRKIFPLNHSEVISLSEARQLFAEYEISVIVPSILWLRDPHNGIEVQSSGELFVLEMGQIIAGTPPPGVNFADGKLTGIFQFQAGIENTNFRLFTV